MLTEPNTYLSIAAVAGVVAIAGFAVVHRSARAGASKRTVRLLALSWGALVCLIDFPAVLSAAIRASDPEVYYFWGGRADLRLTLVPLAVAVVFVGWSWTRGVRRERS
jgi:hypothetical protein